MKLAYILAAKPTPKGIVTVQCGSTVQHAVDELCAHNIGAVVVVDGQTGRMAGILTERDILRALCSNGPLGTRDLSKVPVDDIMTRDVVCATREDKAREVLTVMTTMHIRHMPVMEDGRLIGIISHRDVIRALHRKSEIEFRSSCDYLGGTYGLRVY